MTTGQVNFCDADATYCADNHLLGTAQLTSAGTAVLKLVPGMGSQSYKAVFVGTGSEGTSSSDALALAVSATNDSTTSIIQSGSVGNYTLNATVVAKGLLTPTGTVSFLDTTNGDISLGTATLVKVGGALSWLKSQSLATGNQPVSVAKGDFNGDGIQDLAVVNSGSNSLTIFLGNGDGTFTAAATKPTMGSYPSFVVVGDFNGDGIQDLAVTNPSSNSITIFLGVGDGTFIANAMSLQTGNLPQAIAVGDFNGDGIQDLAVTNANSNTVTVLLGKGDGTFTASALSSQTGSIPKAIVTGDFNGDGILDLAVTNTNSNTVTVLLGNGDGSFTASAVSPSTGYNPNSIAIGDFNGDGKPDLVVTNIWSATVTVLMGDGNGTFTANATSPQTGFGPASVAVGDGTFTAGGSKTTDSYPVAVVVGNFNPGGIPDLAVVNNSSATVTILTSQLTQLAYATVNGISPLGSGTHLIESSYVGDNHYKSSVSGTIGLTAQSGPPAITATLSSSSITTTQILTVTVAVIGGVANPTPSGVVTLACGSYSVQQTLDGGSTTFNLAAGTLPVGSDTLTATYTPDTSSTGTYTTATQTFTMMVTQAAGTVTPTITATPSSDTITNLQDVTVKIAVAGGSGQATPTGTITLTSGTYSAQQTLSSGAASFTIAAGTLNSGSNTLTAFYSGDEIYVAASGTITVIVSQIVAAAPTPTPITPGASATGIATFTAGSTYSGTLNLTCTLTGSPTGAKSLPTCNLSPASIPLASGGSGTTTLTVKTTAASTSAVVWPFQQKLWGLGGRGVVFAFTLLFGVPSRRRWMSILVLFWVIAAAGAIGCGGGGGQNTTQSPTQSTSATSAGSYTFTVAGRDSVSAQVIASVNVSVTIQ